MNSNGQTGGLKPRKATTSSIVEIILFLALAAILMYCVYYVFDLPIPKAIAVVCGALAARALMFSKQG